MKISTDFPMLIASFLLLIVAGKKAAYADRCTIRCDKINKVFNERSKPGNNISKQSFNLIDEKDFPFLFIPFYLKYY
ncbi:MAG: hypothetical protein ABI760_15195 [Ferruginibacter sp.]